MSTTAFQFRSLSRRIEQPRTDGLSIRMPNPTDGAGVHALVRQCPPLDLNSLYAYVLQCEDFADTCILAENADRTLAWVSAYRQPSDPSTLLVWQVAVHAEARGLGLGRRLILDLLRRPAALGVEQIKTTITPDNQASFALFESVAAALDAPIERRAWFDRDAHFAGRHQSEYLITIGPFDARGKGAKRARTQ